MSKKFMIFCKIIVLKLDECLVDWNDIKKRFILYIGIKKKQNNVNAYYGKNKNNNDWNLV